MFDERVPAGAIVLAVVNAEFGIAGGGSREAILLGAKECAVIYDLISNNTADSIEDRICLLLANVKGSNDATALSVFATLQPPADASSNTESFVESFSLYGLRRASIQVGNDDGGSGLSFIADITKVVVKQLPTNPVKSIQVHIDIVPEPPLPDSVRIMIGYMGIFIQKHSR